MTRSDLPGVRMLAASVLLTAAHDVRRRTVITRAGSSKNMARLCAGDDAIVWAQTTAHSRALHSLGFWCSILDIDPHATAVRILDGAADPCRVVRMST